MRLIVGLSGAAGGLAALSASPPMCVRSTELARLIGVVHTETDCGGGLALGPSAMHVGLLALVLIGLVASGSESIRQSIAAALLKVIPLRAAAVAGPVRVTVAQSDRGVWRNIIASPTGSRDPPVRMSSRPIPTNER